MMQIHTDVEVTEDEMQAATDYLDAIIIAWTISGNEPMALVLALSIYLNELCEAVGEPMH